jgi:hypothetical protein
MAVPNHSMALLPLANGYRVPRRFMSLRRPAGATDPHSGALYHLPGTLVAAGVGKRDFSQAVHASGHAQTLKHILTKR